MNENATNRLQSRSGGAKMKKNEEDGDEPSVWVTVVKLLAIAVALIGGTGFALWYVDQMQVRDQPPGLSTGNNASDWGIVGDSPLRNRR
jgi:nitrate reductase NapE component